MRNEKFIKEVKETVQYIKDTGCTRVVDFSLFSIHSRMIIEHSKYASRDDFDSELVRAIKAANIDLVVLAGFMRVLGANFCDNVKAINLHPSILPLFKGAHAIKESFESDMQVGGITVHWVSSELDGGKIIAQKTFARKNRTFKQWEEKIHKLEHKLLPKTIISLLKD